MTSLRVLVMTVVHHPQDTRIFVRQISALVDAGHQVTFAAPFSAVGVTPPPGVTAFDLPRSRGRHRVAAMRAARRTVRELAAQHDVVLIHDPELVLCVTGVKDVPIVWDVHEDTAAAVSYKDWIPAGLDRAAAAGVRVVERWAERRLDLVLAEAGYREPLTSSRSGVCCAPMESSWISSGPRHRRSASSFGALTSMVTCDGTADCPMTR